MGSCKLGIGSGEVVKSVGEAREGVRKESFVSSREGPVREHIEKEAFGRWMMVEGRKRPQARFQPRPQVRAPPRDKVQSVQTVQKVQTVRGEWDGSHLKVQTVVQGRRGEVLRDKAGDRFLVRDNPFAVLEMEGEGLVGGKDGERRVMCPVGVGEVEMRLAEVGPMDEEVGDDVDDELVDEEIVIEDELGRNVRRGMVSGSLEASVVRSGIGGGRDVEGACEEVLGREVGELVCEEDLGRVNGEMVCEGAWAVMWRRFVRRI